MIFVTVGTHEQQFNRLIKAVDDLKAFGNIKESVIIQTGYSTYKPQYCEWNEFFSYQDMTKSIDEARIVITHGGPSSFIMPLQMGKIPIVFPRQKKFAEHVNDHQLTFVKTIAERYGYILPAYNVEQLRDAIINYDALISNNSTLINTHTQYFNDAFDKVVKELFNL